jgi:hypothetical protein
MAGAPQPFDALAINLNRVANPDFSSSRANSETKQLHWVIAVVSQLLILILLEIVPLRRALPPFAHPAS